MKWIVTFFMPCSIYYYFVAEHTLKEHMWIEFTQIPLIIFMEGWIQTVFSTDIVGHNLLLFDSV
jgi:hypothetical protein